MPADTRSRNLRTRRHPRALPHTPNTPVVGRPPHTKHTRGGSRPLFTGPAPSLALSRPRLGGPPLAQYALESAVQHWQWVFFSLVWCRGLRLGTSDRTCDHTKKHATVSSVGVRSSFFRGHWVKLRETTSLCPRVSVAVPTQSVLCSLCYHWAIISIGRRKRNWVT